jgi:hypothetical protein
MLNEVSLSSNPGHHRLSAASVMSLFMQPTRVCMCVSEREREREKERERNREIEIYLERERGREGDN